MSAQTQPRLTPEEYLALDRASEFRNEYYDGHMYAMSYGPLSHSLIKTNLCAEIRQALKETPTDVAVIGMRMQISPRACAYPDLAVVREPALFADDLQDILLNPILLIEVLSPSTELVDREFKSRHYRAIESLQEYALVWQSEPHIEIYRRQATGDWLLSEPHGLDASCRFESTGCEVLLSEIYYQISFEPET